MHVLEQSRMIEGSAPAWAALTVAPTCCAIEQYPKQRDIAFGAGVLTALAHAGYIMSSDTTMWGGDGRLER